MDYDLPFDSHEALPTQVRTVHSYVRRQGRLTTGQQRAISRCWRRYGIDAEGDRLDLDLTFGRPAPKVLEIGFGNGTSLIEMASVSPDMDFLGIEVHEPGIGHLLMLLERANVGNVRIIRGDAVSVMRWRLADASLDRIQLYFPDPWPKQRHHKRRIVQPDWVQLVAQKLKIGGTLQLATDWEDYAHHMMRVVSQDRCFLNSAGHHKFAPTPDDRPTTKFERRGRDRGHGIWDLIFLRRE